MRWCLAGALLCGAVLSMPRVRAEGAGPMPAGSGPDPRAAPTLPAADPGSAAARPPRSGGPGVVDPVEAALRDAEALYRAARSEEAAAAFRRIVELDPLNARAWLRLGNLGQQAGRQADALAAYEQATLAVPSTAADAEARGKALLNVALLRVAQASRAIDDLDEMDLAALRTSRDDVARQVGAQRRRASRATSRWVEDGAGAPAAAVRPVAAERPVPAEPFEPYTVDRWTGRGRRPVAARGAAKPVVAEPVTEHALPSPPQVETLIGNAARRR
jgi:hypothetical protein